jgi:hypothetical protein
MRVLAVAALLAFLPLAAHAERATERYAPAQLGVARDLLDQARAAASLQEYASAGKLAWQALVDARIAYGMTDAAALQGEAAAIAAQSSELTRQIAGLTTNSRAPAAESYRSASAQAQAGAPNPR